MDLFQIFSEKTIFDIIYGNPKNILGHLNILYSKKSVKTQSFEKPNFDIDLNGKKVKVGKKEVM